MLPMWKLPFGGVQLAANAGGSDQATATLVTDSHVDVATAAVGGGMRLPELTAEFVGMEVFIANRSASDIYVWPSSGQTIYPFSVDLAAVQKPGQAFKYVATQDDTWTQLRDFSVVDCPTETALDLNLDFFPFYSNTLNRNAKIKPLYFPINIVQQPAAVDVDPTTDYAPYYDASTGLVKRALFDEIFNKRSVNTQYSLSGGGNLGVSRTLSLLNDSAAPGNDFIYGTNGSGVKGWYSLLGSFKPPIFQATIPSNQGLSNATYTKVDFTTEIVDSNNWYDTGNKRHTPQLPGWYEYRYSSRLTGSTPTVFIWGLYKNGSPVATATSHTNPPTYDARNVTRMVYMNGTTDFMEAYSYIAAASGQTIEAGDYTYFEGRWVSP